MKVYKNGKNVTNYRWAIFFIQTGGKVSVVHMKMLLALFEVAEAVELLKSINSILSVGLVNKPMKPKLSGWTARYYCLSSTESDQNGVLEKC